MRPEILICKTFGSLDENTPPFGEQMENSKAIVSAINNTYGASINPEAVKEMFQALAHVIYVETGVCTQGERRTAFERAKAAIEKATIK